MEKKRKTVSSLENLWSGTKKRIVWIVSGIMFLSRWIPEKFKDLLKELVLDRVTGWINNTVDNLVSSFPKNYFIDALSSVLSWMFRDIFNLVSAIGAILILGIIIDSWLITRKQGKLKFKENEKEKPEYLTPVATLNSDALPHPKFGNSSPEGAPPLPVGEGRVRVPVLKKRKSLVGGNLGYLYKAIVFQQHWFQPNLIESVYGNHGKGIGIRIDNNGNLTVRDLQVKMKRSFYKKNLSDDFSEISIETQSFWWNLGNSHSVILEKLEKADYGILMFANTVPAFPHFVFTTSAFPPDENYTGIPRHDGFYKTYLQFNGLLDSKGIPTKMKPIIFRAEFKYENFEFSEFKGQGYCTEV